MKGAADFPGDVILQNEVEGSTELSESDLVSIHKAKVSRFIWVDGVNIDVRGLDESGCFAAHKPPG